jgi:tRNA pseudouridine38-40 synthase
LRYFFHIGYLGTNYHGWQKHPDGISVQQVLEACLSQVFKKSTYITGCGRTDAQVHASQFFFHMDAEEAWDFDLVFRMNNILPDDISAFDVIPMEGLPHVRFDATERSYDYFIHTYKDPFLSNFSSMYLVKDWDVSNMQRAAGLLLNYTDYHAFCKMPGRNEHTITGKLIEIGTGKLSVDEFEAHLIDPQLPQLIKPAYPQGLYLSKIKYPYLDLPSRSDFTQMLAGGAKGWEIQP